MALSTIPNRSLKNANTHFLLDFSRYLPWHWSNKKYKLQRKPVVETVSGPYIFCQTQKYFSVFLHSYCSLTCCPEPSCHYPPWMSSTQVWEGNLWQQMWLLMISTPIKCPFDGGNLFSLLFKTTAGSALKHAHFFE